MVKSRRGHELEAERLLSPAGTGFPEQSDIEEADPGPAGGQTKPLIGRQVGSYRVLSELGSGGMGRVYLAQDTGPLARQVALKFLSEEMQQDLIYRKRFLHEAINAASLDHSFICKIYEVDETDSYIAMEYVEGETLEDRLAEASLPIEKTLQIVVEIGEALGKAHTKGIVHRDLKPSNVMLTSDGHTKVMDFGLAKRVSSATLQQEDQDTTLTHEGQILGTAPYMSPEQTRGETVDPRSDIFSLGVLTYEMLTGVHPFRKTSRRETRKAIRNEDPRPISSLRPEVPRRLSRTVARMLEKDPADRPEGVAPILAQLNEIQGQLLPRGHLVKLFRALRRRPLFLAPLALVLFAVIYLANQLVKDINAGPPLPDHIHLAVLPFEVTAGGVERQLFSSGLSEAVTTKLTRLTLLRDLQVPPASRVAHLQSRGEARNALGANLTLEVSLDESEAIVTVHYALRNTVTLKETSGGSFRVQASDPFGLQDRLLDEIVRMLKLELTSDEERSIRDHGTTVAEAYDAYLQGRGRLFKRQKYEMDTGIQDAIGLFHQALRLDPPFAPALASLAEIHFGLYQTLKTDTLIETARRQCQSALSLDPNLAAAHLRLGMIRQARGEKRDAIAEFETAIRLEPTSDIGYRTLAEAYERDDDLDQAIATYERGIQVRSHYWVMYDWLGTLFYRHQRWAEAVSHYDQAIKLAPDYAGASLRNRGAANIHLGRYEDATKDLRKAVQLNPTFKAYSNLGSVYLRLRQFPFAIESLEQALKLQESDYRVAGNLARAYYWGGEVERARQTYLKAIDLARQKLQDEPDQPDEPDVRLLLSVYLAMVGKREEALTELTAALGARPGRPDYLFHAAMTQNSLQNREEALDCIKQALDGGWPLAEIEGAMELDDLRTSEDFKELMGKFKDSVETTFNQGGKKDNG